MELWDAYIRNGVKTGGVLVRGQRMIPEQLERMRVSYEKMGYLK